MPKTNPTHRKRHSEKGLAPLVLIIIVAVVVAAAGGFLYMSKSGGNLVSSIPGVGSMMQPSDCPYSDSNICKFMASYTTTKDMTMTSVVTQSNGKKMESIIEVSGDTKFHMVSKDGSKEVSNMISIDDTTYTKDYSDNSWMKFTQPKEAQELKNNIKKSLFEEPTGEPNTTPVPQTTFKSLGKEACGSLQCFKYQMMEPSMTDATQYIWFDDREYKMRRTQTTTEDGAISDTIYAYTTVSINVPSPVKELPDYGSALKKVPGVSQNDIDKMQKNFEQMQKSQPSGGSEEDYIPSSDDTEY
jgi:outer membrane lipoprotein-sorting protein